MPLPLSEPAVRGSDRAYAQIRDRIVDLRLPPGTAINEQAVATELGLGRMPVREGLARLAHERFVTVVPRRGTRVAPVGVHDLVDLFEAREVLECGVAHLAAARATPADLRRLERLVARADRRTGRRTVDERLRADHEVHTALLRVVGNAVLQDAGERLLLHSLRVGRACAVDAPDVAHADLLAALTAGKADRAAAAMRVHVRATHRQLRAALPA